MITVVVTEEFESRYADLPKPLQKKADKQTALFSQNPYYPSLGTEKLEPRDKGIWSLRIDKKYRILFRFTDHQTAIFLTLGPHDWIYKRIF